MLKWFAKNRKKERTGKSHVQNESYKKANSKNEQAGHSKLNKNEFLGKKSKPSEGFYSPNKKNNSDEIVKEYESIDPFFTSEFKNNDSALPVINAF
ncbi:MAG: hypothetical protein KDJ99_14885 [Candidatus Competibacteraceae bacterium]|nr:hypothetical protein [Candidatus Competibacteraceae bacterium]